MSTTTDNPHATFKFPAFQPDLLPTYEEEEPAFAFSSSRNPSPSPSAHRNGTPVGTSAHGILNGSVLPSDRWQPRRSSRANSRVEFADRYSASGVGGEGRTGTRHGRQKSLSEAIRTIRTRKGSVSQNAHEIADALKAPVSWRLLVRPSLPPYPPHTIPPIPPRRHDDRLTDFPGRLSAEYGTAPASAPTPPPRPSSWPSPTPLP